MRAEIGMPRPVASAYGGGESLAMLVGSKEAAKVAAVTHTDARHEHTHVRRGRRVLRVLSAAGDCGRDQRKTTCPEK